MVRDEKNLKDSQFSKELSLKDIYSSPLSYNKTDKLITALYMVTDIIDHNEPLRNKLRKLGTDIISDTYSNFTPNSSHLYRTASRIEEVILFLNLAETLHLVTEMNASILKKEFLQLKEAVLAKISTPQASLLDLLKEELPAIETPQAKTLKPKFIGHPKPARLGLQSASSLMDVLSDTISRVSDRKIQSDMTNTFESFKTKRREEILKVVKYQSNSTTSTEGLAITDIIRLAQEFKTKLAISVLLTSGEKTVQRELVSMVEDGLLNKTGSKRWSRYSIA